MSPPRPVGIIGLGKHGSRYAAHIVRDLDRLRLAAVCRRSPEIHDQARRLGCRAHTDWRRLIADPDVEAVIAVTTPNLNPAIATACAAAGKPLLMEKPLAAHQSEAEEIVRVCAAAGIPLTVGQTLRFNPVVNHLKKHLPAIGALHTLCATHRLEPSTLPWLAEPAVAGGGVIFHTAVHLFDALRYITGREVVRVQARAHRLYNPALEDLFTALIELSGGVPGIVEAGKVSRSRSGRYEFVGKEGQLHGDQVHGLVEEIRGNTVTRLADYPPAPAILGLLTAWTAFLDHEAPNPVPGEEGLAAVRICEACRAAAETGAWHSVDPPTDR